MALEGEDCDLTALIDNYADLVAIGTIGDIVPLTGKPQLCKGWLAVNVPNRPDRPESFNRTGGDGGPPPDCWQCGVYACTAY